MGAGSFDETRIAALTAAFAPSVWSFDPTNKPRSAGRLLARIRRERPDLVVMEGTSIAAGLALLAGRIAFDVPYVFSSGDAVGPFIGLIAPSLVIPGHLYEVALCRFCAGFIGWTPYLAGRALTLGASRAMTAANWAPAPPVADPGGDARAELGIPREAIVFGLVGSLNWNERVGYCYGLELVRAIRQTTRSDVHVVVVGDGSGARHLEAEAGADLGIRVHLPGRLPREQLGRYYRAMDVVSLPQSVDGVGAFRYTTKLSEYLAAGVPVITGQLPFAYDLPGDWLWRLAGDAPWSRTYVASMAALLSDLTREEVARRRNAVPRELPTFDERLQRASVTAFLCDVLERSECRGPAGARDDSAVAPGVRRLNQATYEVAKRLPAPVVGRLQNVAASRASARGVLRRISAPLRAGPHPVASGPARGLLIDTAGSRPSYVLGTAEPLLQAFLSRHLAAGATMYDLGANVGFFTLVAAALVGPNGHVVSFEPSPRNAAALRRNVELNGLSQVIVREAAVSDVVGEASFDVAGDDQSGALGRGGSIVATTTVDVEVRRTGCVPNVIKIDVEGAEDLVIAGMPATLDAHQPIIICEIHTDRPSFAHAVPRALATAGYTLEWLEGDAVVGTFWAPHLVAIPARRSSRPPAAGQ